MKEEQTASYSVEIWKRYRKWGGIPTGITQNAVSYTHLPLEKQAIFENHHEPIIDKETWERVQELRKQRKRCLLYTSYGNIFLSQTEYDELQAEYPDRLERFIEDVYKRQLGT